VLISDNLQMASAMHHACHIVYLTLIIGLIQNLHVFLLGRCALGGLVSVNISDNGPQFLSRTGCLWTTKSVQTHRTKHCFYGTWWYDNHRWFSSRQQ